MNRPSHDVNGPAQELSAPHPFPPEQSPWSPNGFTLLELMIVLALVALLMALAWPTLRRPMLRSVTEQAARQLAEDLSRARLSAIETGEPWVFRFEPDGSRYMIAPARDPGEASLDDQGERYGPIEDSAESDGGTDRDAPSGPQMIDSTLDDDVIFGDPASLADSNPFGDSALGDAYQDELQATEAVTTLREEAADELTGESEFGEGSESVDWASPLLFYPSGRAENAEFLLVGPDEYRVRIVLRGLTGAVTIEPSTHAQRSGIPNDTDLPASDVPAYESSRNDPFAPSSASDVPGGRP